MIGDESEGGDCDEVICTLLSDDPSDVLRKLPDIVIIFTMRLAVLHNTERERRVDIG